MNDVLQNIVDRIKTHEGFRGECYKDPKGIPTIAYGIKLPLTKDEGELLLKHRLQQKWHELINYKPFIVDLPEEVQGVLAEMAYQLGTKGLLGFKNMWRALQERDFVTASMEMLDSKWAREDSPKRAEELAQIVREAV